MTTWFDFRSSSLPLVSNSATKLVAGAELQLPLVLVLLTPLELASREGLAAEDDLVPRVLVLSAGDALNLALGHDAAAAEALLVGHARGEEKSQQDKGPHVWKYIRSGVCTEGCMPR